VYVERGEMLPFSCTAPSSNLLLLFCERRRWKRTTSMTKRDWKSISMEDSSNDDDVEVVVVVAASTLLLPMDSYSGCNNGRDRVLLLLLLCRS